MKTIIITILLASVETFKVSFVSLNMEGMFIKGVDANKVAKFA